jgi:hypothetical protein
MNVNENELTLDNLNDGSMVEWINSLSPTGQSLASAQTTDRAPGFERLYLNTHGTTHIVEIGQTIYINDGGWFDFRDTPEEALSAGDSGVSA